MVSGICKKWYYVIVDSSSSSSFVTCTTITLKQSLAMKLLFLEPPEEGAKKKKKQNVKWKWSSYRIFAVAGAASLPNVSIFMFNLRVYIFGPRVLSVCWQSVFRNVNERCVWHKSRLCHRGEGIHSSQALQEKSLLFSTPCLSHTYPKTHFSQHKPLASHFHSISTLPL